MVSKRIVAIVIWLLVTLTSTFGFTASEVDDPGNRNPCRENGWLNYDTLSGYSVATNKTAGLSDDIAATFKNGNATRIVLDKPLTVSRFHGGNSGRVGRFASGDAFNSRRAVRQRLGLKQEWGNRISKRSDVTLPEGTVIWRGPAASQLQKNRKLLRGGGDQIWIESDLNSAWFNNTVHFK